MNSTTFTVYVDIQNSIEVSNLMKNIQSLETSNINKLLAGFDIESKDHKLRTITRFVEIVFPKIVDNETYIAINMPFHYLEPYQLARENFSKLIKLF